jgi:hypothetical protein
VLRVPIRVPLAVALAALIAGAACRDREAAAKQTPQVQMVWRAVGSWSGRGNRQTESFTSDSGALRVRWEASALPGEPAASGTLRLVAHSAISGRVLQEVLDQHGPGSGTGYVSQDPHVFYMSVESSGLAWSFSVEEGIAAEIVGARSR